MAGEFPTSYKDPLYASLADKVEKKLGLPSGLVASVILDGEKTNADRVSSAGARTVAQIIPSTRDAILKKWGIDPYLSPENAIEGAGLLLKENLDRNNGDVEQAVRTYHGGVNRENWGPVNEAYWQRVGAGLQSRSAQAMSAKFAKWMQDNPAAAPLNAPATNKPAAAPGQDQLAAGFGNWLAASDQIPGGAIPADRQPPSLGIRPQPAPDAPGIIDKAIGTGEAGLTALTGAVGGTVGGIAGTAKGLTQAVLDGSFGTPQAVQMVEQAAADGMSALTYQPRTESGQAQAEALGQAMQQVLPAVAVAPGMVPVVAGARPAPVPVSVAARAGLESGARAIGGETGAALAAQAGDATLRGAQRVAQLSKEATTLPRRALESIGMGGESARPTAGTKGSAGAAATDLATQRRVTAEQLGFEGDAAMTLGQATRDPMQIKFEAEIAKNPEIGAPLRERVAKQGEVFLRKFDDFVDETGAEAASKRGAGEVVDKALRDSAARDKVQIRTAYKAAENAGEMEAPVSLQSAIDHLNDSIPEAETAPILKVARQKALSLGVAVEGPDGLLVAQPVPLKIAETFRRTIGAATDYEPTNIRQSTIVKGLIDESTATEGGALYKQARQLRAKYAQDYENRAVVSKLLNNKRGTADRQVALEDVFDHSVLRSSRDDVVELRRVLMRAGDDGQQAWRELQGQTAAWVRDQATKGVTTDGSGNAVVSAASLNKALRTLDEGGKLDEILGKKQAQQMRDIGEIAKYVKTVPPEAAVNFSNTASTLLAAFGDAGLIGMTGAPVPVVTMAKTLGKYVKDQKLKARVNEALGDIARKQKAQELKAATPKPAF